eukprot:181737-Lingulodinium_polyedra.AAC.1
MFWPKCTCDVYRLIYVLDDLAVTGQEVSLFGAVGSGRVRGAVGGAVHGRRRQARGPHRAA